MRELDVIERTLAEARDTHLTQELAALTRRVNRLEAELHSLAGLLQYRTRSARPGSGRTRPAPRPQVVGET